MIHSYLAFLLSYRPICGVAGVQAAQNSLQHHLPHPAATAVGLSHCSHSGGAGPTLACSRSQIENSSPVLMAPSPQNPQEQNGILDWLRKLRLHKYYPVFKQLTMEKVWCRPHQKNRVVFFFCFYFSSFLPFLSRSFPALPFPIQFHNSQIVFLASRISQSGKELSQCRLYLRGVLLLKWLTKK